MIIVLIFIFIVVSYEKSDLEYVWKDKNHFVMKSSYLKTTNANLVRNRTYECASTGSWRGNKRNYFKRMVYNIQNMSLLRFFIYYTIFLR